MPHVPQSRTRAARGLSAAPDANISVGALRFSRIDLGVRRILGGHDGLSASRTKQPALDDGRCGHWAPAPRARAHRFAIVGFHSHPTTSILSRNFEQIKPRSWVCCSYAKYGVATLFDGAPTEASIVHVSDRTRAIGSRAAARSRARDSIPAGAAPLDQPRRSSRDEGGRTARSVSSDAAVDR